VAEGTARQPSPDGQRTVKVKASEKDSKLSGTIDVSSGEGTPWKIDVECKRDLEGALVLAGTASPAWPDGGRAAVIIKQGPADQMIIWHEDPPPADSCASMVQAIPTGVVTDLMPIDGDIKTPWRLAPERSDGVQATSDRSSEVRRELAGQVGVHPPVYDGAVTGVLQGLELTAGVDAIEQVAAVVGRQCLEGDARVRHAVTRPQRSGRGTRAVGARRTG